MVEQAIAEVTSVHDDRILPLTHYTAWFLIPFLVAAFIILYVDGSQTAAWFAWDIPVRLTSALMGAGYLGGAYFFLRVGLGRRQNMRRDAGYLDDGSQGTSGSELRWHHFHLGYPPVTFYAITMVLATVLHLDKFITQNWPFWVWLVLYIIAPLLVPAVWWLNRRTDPILPGPGEQIVPNVLRMVLAFCGGFLLAVSVTAFIVPEIFIELWPWTLTPLTARVTAGWHALLGFGALVLASDRRWSSWRVPMQSIALWYGLFLPALVWHREELGAAGLMNWYTLFTAAGLAGLMVVTLIMRGQPRIPIS